MKFREIKIPRRPGCDICGSHPKITELIEYNQVCDMETDFQHYHDEPLDDDITAIQLKQELTKNPKLVLLDVREPVEWDMGHLPNAWHIPFQQIPQQLNELSPEKDYIIYCHTGIRSRYVLEYLKEKGFPNVRNLFGGIDAWSVDIDPALPRY
jgi:adenylyltransferase/sulfurtransferase